MTRSGPPKYTPFYDLFKLIVSILLALILIILLLSDRGRFVPPAPLLTATLTPSGTAPLPTSSPLPSSTPSPGPPTQVIPTSDTAQCPSSPSHVQVGDKVRVLSWLNFRTGPGLNWPIIVTNRSGLLLEVVGGPVCTTRNTAEGPKAYLWWHARMENGQEGWSAEAPLIIPEYFLEPIQ